MATANHDSNDLSSTDHEITNHQLQSDSNSQSLNSDEKSNWFDWLPSWKRTSEETLEEVEKLVLKNINSDYTDQFVPIADTTHIRTLSMAPQQSASDTNKYPLVMVHGFGAGLGCFYKNFDHLHSKRSLHAFDVLGFGRSTRATFSEEPELVEDEFVESIEKWRQAMGIDKMILLGHSLGAFMATSYTMKYPDRVRHLIIVDCWGFLEEPEEIDHSRVRRFRFLVPVVQAYFKVFTPFSMVRALGPIGPSVISRFRPDLQEKFGEDFMSYVYHCNAQIPTGEKAFFYMQSNLIYAKLPMINRIDDLPYSIPISMVFGKRSWFDSSVGKKVYTKRSHSFVDVHFVEEAGHHIHADCPEVFNRVVNEICEMADNDGDIVSGTEIRDEQIAFHTHS